MKWRFFCISCGRTFISLSVQVNQLKWGQKQKNWKNRHGFRNKEKRKVSDTNAGALHHPIRVEQMVWPQILHLFWTYLTDPQPLSTFSLFIPSLVFWWSSLTDFTTSKLYFHYLYQKELNQIFLLNSNFSRFSHFLCLYEWFPRLFILMMIFKLFKRRRRQGGVTTSFTSILMGSCVCMVW